MSFDTRINTIMDYFSNHALSSGGFTYQQLKAEIIYNINNPIIKQVPIIYEDWRNGSLYNQSLALNETSRWLMEYTEKGETWEEKCYIWGTPTKIYNKINVCLNYVKNLEDYLPETITYTPKGTLTKAQFIEEYGDYLIFDAKNRGGFPARSAKMDRGILDFDDGETPTSESVNLYFGSACVPLADRFQSANINEYLGGSSRLGGVAGTSAGEDNLYSCYYAIDNNIAIWEGSLGSLNATINHHNFRLFEKTTVDEIIDDLKNIGVNIGYVEPSLNPYVPTEPEETAPGQPDNPVDNQGGTGNFTSDLILIQQTGATGTSSYAGTTYALNRASFRDVKRALWDADYLTLIKNLFGSGQNTVINCLLFPFNISGITSNLIPVTSVYLGTHEVELTSPSAAYALSSGSIGEVTIGPLTGFQKVLGGFLDDNGVTECYIHLPFIGMQQIDPEIIYDHTVSVKYLFDFMTGECQALIYSNMATDETGQTFTSQMICCYEFSGQAGIPIGFSESNLNSLILNVGINALKGAFQGGASGAGEALVEGAMSVIGAPAAHMEGSTGSSIERLKSLDVFLMFIRPKTAIPNTYNKTKGRPSGISAALSSLKGFTVIEDPIIETTATDEEREQIIQLLKEGVRIK